MNGLQERPLDKAISTVGEHKEVMRLSEKVLQQARVPSLAIERTKALY